MTSIERATPDDTPAIEALLRANDLPVGGLAQALALAVVVRDGDSVVGCAAEQVVHAPWVHEMVPAPQAVVQPVVSA